MHRVCKYVAIPQTESSCFYEALATDAIRPMRIPQYYRTRGTVSRFESTGVFGGNIRPPSLRDNLSFDRPELEVLGKIRKCAAALRKAENASVEYTRCRQVLENWKESDGKKLQESRTTIENERANINEMESGTFLSLSSRSVPIYPSFPSSQ